MLSEGTHLTAALPVNLAPRSAPSPCPQFLPQDKVGDFAKLKPVELLAETQKAIGDARLHALHRELIQERNQLKTEETVRPAWVSAAVLAGSVGCGSHTCVAKQG